MSIFVLVNNSSTVKDGAPMKLFLEKDIAIQALYDCEMKSVFKPILLYEYLLQDGFADIPKSFTRIVRNGGIVTGHEQIPVNPKEFVKTHPFLFDKFESLFDPSTKKERAC